jgi:hypothetical protein
MGKWDYLKLKSFCTTKEMISKLKIPPTEWQNIFTTYISDKGLVIKIYRVLTKLNSPQINELIRKWTTELNRTFFKEEIQVSKNHMKKCSPSLAIKEMQIKTTLRLHLSPVRIAIHQEQHQQQILTRMRGKTKPSYTAGGNVSWCNHSGKHYGGSLNN